MGEDLRYYTHTMHLFYKVINSELYGDKGSVGYASSKIEVKEIPSIEDEKEHAEIVRKSFAEMARVPLENIIRISKSEFDENVEDDEDDEDQGDLGIYDYDNEQFHEEEEE